MMNKVKGFTLCASLFVAYFSGIATGFWLQETSEDRKKRIAQHKQGRMFSPSVVPSPEASGRN
jgi:hypothetical protein